MRTKVWLTIFLSNPFSCVWANSEGEEEHRRCRRCILGRWRLLLFWCRKGEEKMSRTKPDWHEIQNLMRHAKV